MKSREQIITHLTNPGIIAVVRAQSAEQVPPLTEALLKGGVTTVEITMTTPNAIEAIRHATREFSKEALIGVGTVLNESTCQSALDAGAQFVVSPIGRFSLVPMAHSAGKPVMLGAYTPTEAQAVHESGSDFVKLFPADSLGASYIKALRAPLPHLRIVPTGGVDVGTVADFLKAGCAALGVGSALVSAQILKEGNWKELTRRAEALVAAVEEAKA